MARPVASSALRGTHSIMGVLHALYRWIPVLIVWAIIVSSYYIFVVELCTNSIDSKPIRIVILVFGHILYIVLCWCFIKAIVVDVPTPPSEFYLSSEAASQLMLEVNEDRSVQLLNTHARTLDVLCRLPNGCVRFCNICMCVKPDRCHHCSACGTCVLRMDHHCPWINACVHFNNYKFFLLAVFWALITTLYLLASCSKYFVQYWSVNSGVSDVTRGCIIYMFLMGVVVTVSLTSLLSFHIFLVFRNRTTLENYRPPSFANGPQRRGFDLGVFKNVQAVFGPFGPKMFLPVHNWHGDGVHFEPRHPAIDSQL